jgi:uncharacterized membrane protein
MSLWLWLGILLFFGPHFYSVLMSDHRTATRHSFGEKRFKGLYALVSLAGIILMAVGYVAGRNEPGGVEQFYEPWFGARHAAMGLILIGFILIFSNQTKGYIRATLKHPFSIGVAFWSIAHLLVNGEKAVVVIFGAFLILSVLDVILGLARGKVAAFAPNWKHDLRGLIVGLVLYLVFMFGFHPYILGVPVVG